MKDGSTPASPSNGYVGMSLRQRYAGTAPITLQDAARACVTAEDCIGGGAVLVKLARLRFEYADAMIAEDEEKER